MSLVYCIRGWERYSQTIALDLFLLVTLLNEDHCVLLVQCKYVSSVAVCQQKPCLSHPGSSCVGPLSFRCEFVILEELSGLKAFQCCHGYMCIL